jgi:GntR family transcriptional regulator
LIVVKRGVGMFVASGAAARLRSSERETFIKSEWPAICDRMAQLGIDPTELFARA